MTDDQIDVKEVAEENSQIDSSPTEQTLEEPMQTGAEPANTPDAEEPREDSQKKGAQHRIRELNAIAKEEKARADSLAQKVAELTGQLDPYLGFQPTTAPQVSEEFVREGEELTHEELNRRLQERDNKLLQKAAALNQMQNQQRDFLNKVNHDSTKAMQEFKELDPESDAFQPELSESVTEATLAYIKANPGGSVENFVKKMMKPYKASVTREVAREAATIAKQSAETALRPTNVKPVEKPFSELSVKEMEQKLGMTHY